MNNVGWNPEEYLLGNYFQNEINESFRKSFEIEPSGSILDIGCGDGQYSALLANNFKNSHILGIDSSPYMINHANKHWASENLSFEVHSIEAFQSPITFDFALSFWCLHWTNIDLAFPAIFQLLKNEGRIHAVFSSSSDNSILQVMDELYKKNIYQNLAYKPLELKKVDKKYFYRVMNVLNQLPFKHIKLDLKSTHTYFPNIDYFKNLLLTMPFMKRIPLEYLTELIENMSDVFQTQCERKYNGALYYETRPIFLEAIK